MKVKDIIKKQTTIIAIAVILVTIAAIGVSYAIFFDIKSGQKQVITAGTLKMTITTPGNNPSSSSLSVQEPLNDESGLSSQYVTYQVSNTKSNLPASYKIYLCTAADSTLDTSYLKFSNDGDAKGGKTAKSLGQDGANSVAEEKNKIENTAENSKCFMIDQGTMTANQKDDTTKYLRVWLDETKVLDDFKAVLNLDLFIVSEVDEDQT